MFSITTTTQCESEKYMKYNLSVFIKSLKTVKDAAQPGFDMDMVSGVDGFLLAFA